MVVPSMSLSCFNSSCHDLISADTPSASHFLNTVNPLLFTYGFIFKKFILRKTAAFNSYGLKTKRTS